LKSSPNGSVMRRCVLAQAGGRVEGEGDGEK